MIKGRPSLGGREIRHSAYIRDASSSATTARLAMLVKSVIPSCSTSDRAAPELRGRFHPRLQGASGAGTKVSNYKLTAKR